MIPLNRSDVRMGCFAPFVLSHNYENKSNRFAVALKVSRRHFRGSRDEPQGAQEEED